MVFDGTPTLLTTALVHHYGGQGNPIMPNGKFVFRLASGLCVRTEEYTSAGRIDALVETEDTIYLFEFKLNGTAEDALKQIDEKGYAIPYQSGTKRIVKVGVNFDKELRTIERWLIEDE